MRKRTAPYRDRGTRRAAASRKRRLPGNHPRSARRRGERPHGSGRTQRELFDQLLSESCRGLTWNLIDKAEFHDACHRARAAGALDPLDALFARIVDDDPAYLYH